ncbi:MAG TPA: molybdopterin-dependent oxidoreductase [Planctomycetota bacterium]|jgi:DMSO/TMAO reductase YedYZ molybdopterin-dependent catalytic subunit|nr:molybdopterin-dependent oxidoreductase [Planctomycetota bacterium]
MAAPTRGRIPPGQRPTSGWPILHVGEIPPLDPKGWDIRIGGLVDTPLRFGWADLASLPRESAVGDFHCVSGWTRSDIHWEGIRLRALAERAGVRPEARFARFTDGGKYDTTLPLALALGPEVLLATHGGGGPLSPEHGGPLRLVVMRRYGWKSVKWLRTVDFLAEDRLGFWEVRGYSNAADPWREERDA